jgi:hypothetical protein
MKSIRRLSTNREIELYFPNFRECGFNPRQHWGRPKLRNNSPCLGKMLNCEGILPFNFIEQAQYHISPAHKVPIRGQTVDS